VPALPSSILEPLWVQVSALLPTRPDTHPLGCHRPRIADRVVFDKLIQVLVFGCGYRRIADHTCSATTLHWQPRVAGNSPPNCNAATARDSHAGVPRAIANDRMPVEVEMAGRIDGIADAAG
jgi:hypothetical protein